MAKRKANMKEAGVHVRKAIWELEPAVKASCPNELAMRFTMALIHMNNAFEEAGLRPLEMSIPIEPVEPVSNEKPPQPPPVVQGQLFSGEAS